MTFRPFRQLNKDQFSRAWIGREGECVVLAAHVFPAFCLFGEADS